MPSRDLLPRFQEHLTLKKQWYGARVLLPSYRFHSGCRVQGRQRYRLREDLRRVAGKLGQAQEASHGNFDDYIRKNPGT